MTRLSRALVHAGYSLADKPRAKRIPVVWYALCILPVASGCLYLGPFPTLEDNVPPVIVETSDPTMDESDIPIAIRTDSRAVYVVADDADGDDIAFNWALSEDGIIGDSVPLNWPSGEGSQVKLDRDEALEGQQLICYVDDGESELVILRWELEVP